MAERLSLLIGMTANGRIKVSISRRFMRCSLYPNAASSLGEGTRISQLAFVPLSEKHAANGSIESDRLLLATGLVRVPVQDTNGNSQLVNSTAALYDGQQWTPLLTGVQQDGSSGSASGLFYSQHSFNFRTKSECKAALVALC